MFPRLKSMLSVMLLALPSISAHATQRVDLADRKHVEVHISAREQNRLAVAGRRIATVVPSQKGALSFIKDETLGALYFTLSHPLSSVAQGTMTLFVTDEDGVVYKLILVPKPIAGEEIILTPPKKNEPHPVAFGFLGEAVEYQRRVKDLVLIMADPDLSPDIKPIPIHKAIPLWKGGKLVLLSKYIVGSMVGEKYRLTNTSTSDMILAEQELYRRGVLAASIEHHTLASGHSTDIYIVRKGAGNG